MRTVIPDHPDWDSAKGRDSRPPPTIAAKIFRLETTADDPCALFPILFPSQNAEITIWLFNGDKGAGKRGKMEVILRPGGDDVVSYDAKSLGMYYYLIRNALPHKITFHHDPNLSLTQSFPVVRANGTSSDGTFVSAFQQLSGIDMCDDFILVGYVEQILETAFYQYWVMDEQNRGHTNHLYRHDYMQSWMGSYLAPLLTNTTHHHCNIPLAVGCDHFEGTLQWLAARMDERGFDENGRVESVFIGYISLLLLFPLPNPTLLTTLQRYPKIVSAVQTAMKGIGINLPDPQPTPTPSTRTANTTGVRLVAFAMVATCFLLWRARQSS